MIKSTKDPNKITDPLSWAHPLVRDWFSEKLGKPTEPQILGWAAISNKKTTLISAPTGSGKTLAAFLSCINRLVIKAVNHSLKPETEILYISPLKALSNDIHKNLTEPLAEIKKLAHLRNIIMDDIDVAVRTGDTMMKDRQKMIKKPPHILVTTPESLYILLTASKSREILKNVKTVIVDEIHALVNNKRGSHLALSLERLTHLVQHNILRIGLSATQKPIETVAEFLAGPNRLKPVIIDKGHVRKLELNIEVPNSELGPVASNEMWDEIYDKITNLSEQNRSILVFVNTRRLAERIAHHLSERIGEDQVTAHHGSLSRKLRHDAENKLKLGKLKVLVATASLELGIDIGTVDLVCQIGSPRAMSIALQRVGRSGHWYGAISRGLFFATTRDELLECCALVYAISHGKLDNLIIPKEPIDILAQQIIASCAADDWLEADLYKMIKEAYPYKNLSLETFHAVIEMLSNGVAGSRGRYGAYLFRDQINGIVKGRRGSRLTAITSGGAIPETGLFSVVAEPDGAMVGTLDEDFAVESNRGDIILLGTTSWQIKRVENAAGRVLVENAHGAPPNVPFWRGEAPGRTIELSEQVSDLRQILNDLLPIMDPPAIEIAKQHNTKEAIQWLKTNCSVDESGAEQLIEYLLQGRAILGSIPTLNNIIAERFFDESGGMQLIIHAPLGMKINKAWGLALRKSFCRSFNFELQAAATDNGLNICLAEQHSFPLADVFHFIHPNSLKENLIQAILQSPIFKTRWRWTATRSLALVRFRNGRKVPPNIQRMLSDDLLAAVFPDAAACQDNLAGRDIELPDHPLINETMKDILTDALDLEGFTKLITAILQGSIRCIAVDTPTPSVFCHEILNANPYAFLDDAPLEERRARAVEMRRTLPETLLQNIGKLDPTAILEIQQQAWPDIRSEDELQDALQTFIAIPESVMQKAIHWPELCQILNTQKRVGSAKVNGIGFWFAVEKQKTFSIIYPNATMDTHLKEIEKVYPNKEDAMVNLIQGWIQHLGPTTNEELSSLLQIESSDTEQALLRLENSGSILRGNFRNIGSIEWCDRRLLARIHRLTLGQLRKEIAPVNAAVFMNWLLKWQHLGSGNQLRGENGLFEIIKQLQGFELPANAWEGQIFSKRITAYERDMLDKLCLTGRVGWGRFSKHASLTIAEDETDQYKRIIPTSIVPITFFVREELCELNEEDEAINTNVEINLESSLSSNAKKILRFLEKKGASFFSDIQRGIHILESELENGLWELVAVGAITADSFDNLRALIDPQRRLNKRGRHGRTRYSTGRWSVLTQDHLTIEEQCWSLLKRYGVVFRDLLQREKNLPRWRDLLISLRRLEDRGEIRGGRFVDGFNGEQFALPYVVDSIRAFRSQQPKNEIISISAMDPLNLIGIILPGSKVSSLSKKKITFQNGLPIVIPAKAGIQS